MYPSTFDEIFGIFVHQQVKELVRQGCEVKVISPVPWAPFPINKLSKKWQAYSEIPAQAIIDGIEVFYPRYISFPRSYLFEYSGYFMYLGIRTIVERIYRNFRFDLIHSHMALPDGFAGILVKNKYNSKLIITIHGMDLMITVNRSEKNKKCLEFSFNQADKIITVSNKLRNLGINNFGLPEKVITINNGIYPPKTFDQKLKIRSNNKIKILSVSYLIERKGIEYNLRAVSKLIKKYPEIIYSVIGEGLEKTNLMKLAVELGLDNHVNFIGKVSDSELLDYMSETDIFSLPSWNEGFGVVYIEAMAHGKPVIGCEGEGIEDVVINGKTGLLVEPKNVESLVKALDFLIQHPEEGQAIGKNGKDLVIQNLTWAKNVQKTIGIYREVLNDK